MATAAPLRPDEATTAADGLPARRILTTRTRRHHPIGPRPLVKTTAGVRLAERSHLQLVPRRSHTARIVALVAVVLCALMLATAAFQTRLLPRQMGLDDLDRQIRAARLHYDDLREQRAELLSPSRLTAQAQRLGMVPVDSNVFLAIDPDVVATVQMSSGGVFDEDRTTGDIGMTTNEAVKSVGGFGK